MEFDIRARQGVSPLVAIGESYGNQLVKGIAQQGAIIEESLKQVSTNRQLQSLGQTLSQLDPRSPDYPQKLIGLKGAFPLAASDIRGQQMAAIGFKDHLQWQAAQAAEKRMVGQLGNQKSMVDYRNANRPAANAGIDLSGVALPDNASPEETPTPPSGFSFGAGMGSPASGLNFNPNVDPNAAPNIDPEGALLPPVNFAAVQKPIGGGRTPDASPPGTDPLMERALRPLRDIQIATGAKPTQAQIFRAVEAEKTRMAKQATPAKEQPWKRGADGLFYHTTSDGELEVKTPSDIGVDIEKQLTPAQKQHIEETKLRIKNAGIGKQVDALEKDMASLQKAIYEVGKDEKRAAELAPLQQQFVDVKSKRDELLGGLAGDETPSPVPAPSKKLRYDPSTGSLVPP